MSIDFDSAALQTQHDDEEYDQEDYAREQELHQLLTDLPDDMLEDSVDSSSPELECSTYSNKNAANSPQAQWNQQWSDHTHTQNFEDDYDGSSHGDYAYKDGGADINGHHSQNQPLPHTWTQEHQFGPEDYEYTNRCTENEDFPIHFEPQSAPERTENHMEYNGVEDYTDEHNSRNPFQQEDQRLNQYKVGYNPQHPAHLPKMLNSLSAQQEGPYDQLQRQLLDKTQQNADQEQISQLQILNKAQQRQIEDMERKLEDSRRSLRYLEHQFAIVKDEKDGLAVSLKESSRLVEQAKDREAQMQKKLTAVEQQLQTLNERDQENVKKLGMADAAVDSMKQQMLELCRTDTLSRVREQHDRDITVLKEQHNAALLALQQNLDSASRALSEQIDAGQRLREQVKQLERQREDEQVERAGVVNSLTQRLEESQQQCARLLQTNSVQEMKQMEIKLQQAQSSKALSENMNKALQEDMADLKEQITLYESAVKHGVVALDLSSEWDHHLSESCLDLGFKKAKRKNGILHSVVAQQAESKLPKDEALRLLRAEMQRCLGCLKGKRQKIGQLQEELQQRQAQVNQLQTELEEAKLNSAGKESQMRTPDTQDLMKLQEEKRCLQEQLELLEKQNKELKLSEEKVKCANTELCTKMRQMIQELDQEKQEAAERSERINQQYRDDVVNRLRTELVQEHEAQVEELTALHQQQVQQLQKQLSEISDKMLAVQECYISVCREKSLLEDTIGNTQKEKETEIQQLVDSHVALVEAEWKAKLHEIEKAWTKKLKDSKDQQREAAEVACQTDETEVNGVMISAEELDSRLTAQRQQLQLEADRVQRQAVEDARKHVQRELQKKHLQDMAKQVEGAVTRAYNRWIEDLPSLPEYKARLQEEKEKWEMSQEKLIKQRDTEEQGHRDQPEQHSSGAKRVEELQEEMGVLKSQLEDAATEHAALLKAELAAARAAWNRDKQQEISIIQACSEQACQSKLQEQSTRMEQALQQAREDAELQKKELLLQMEARLEQTLRAREEEWRCQLSERKTLQQMRAEFLAELQSGLAEVHNRLFETTKTDREGTDCRRTSGSTSEATITRIIEASVRDVVNRAVSEAEKEWKRMSEEKLKWALKEAQDQHAREIRKVQSSSSQRKEQLRCSRDCSEALSKLQKKNQELQRHLEKACRQLQHSIREHKRSMQHLKDEHERKLQTMSSDHLQQLEEVKRVAETSGRSSDQHSLHQGLEEMKQQYLTTVEKIRGDMLRYLQESRERAAEMIRTEVQRERQNTARKMRHYYLTCLQELLEDGGKTTGAEKKIMNAASKLAAMAKVLETPIRAKSVKKPGSSAVSTAISGSQPSRSAAFKKNPSAVPERPETSPEGRSHEGKTSADSRQKASAPVKTRVFSFQEGPACDQGLESRLPRTNPSSPPKAASQFHVDFVNLSVSGRNLELYLQGGEPSKADASPEPASRWKPFLVQEPPVREQKPTDWTATSCAVNLPRLSDFGRRVEPVKPFSVSTVREAGEPDSLTSDTPHLTFYEEMPRKPETFTRAKKSAHREPTPGSECGADRSGPLFSELRWRQQDSGFDSPFYQKGGAKDGQCL